MKTELESLLEKAKEVEDNSTFFRNLERVLTEKEEEASTKIARSYHSESYSSLYTVTRSVANQLIDYSSEAETAEELVKSFVERYQELKDKEWLLKSARRTELEFLAREGLEASLDAVESSI